jgi:hypothetical protein
VTLATVGNPLLTASALLAIGLVEQHDVALGGGLCQLGGRPYNLAGSESGDVPMPTVSVWDTFGTDEVAVKYQLNVGPAAVMPRGLMACST